MNKWLVALLVLVHLLTLYYDVRLFQMLANLGMVTADIYINFFKNQMLFVVLYGILLLLPEEEFSAYIDQREFYNREKELEQRRKEQQSP